jgi:hypothetical protein
MNISNELHKPQGLSHFMKALKATFKRRDIDIRQVKDSKLLHLAAEAQNQPDWQTLSGLMQKVAATPIDDITIDNSTPQDNAVRIGRNNLDDLLRSAARTSEVQLSDDSEDDDCAGFENELIGQAVTKIEIVFALSEVNVLKVYIAPDNNDILEAKMHYLPFGAPVITLLTDDELNAIREYIQPNVDFVMQAFNGTSEGWE